MRTFSAKRGGSNLKAKRKRLNIVFATLFAAKQGVGRAEQAQAIDYDYATGASCRLPAHPIEFVSVARNLFIYLYKLCKAMNLLCKSHNDKSNEISSPKHTNVLGGAVALSLYLNLYIRYHGVNVRYVTHIIEISFSQLTTVTQ